MASKEFEFFVKADLRKYSGRYIAIVEDKVIASGDNAKKVFEEAKKKTGKIPTIAKIPRSIGDILEFKIGEKDSIEEIKGIGERGVPIIIKKVRMKIGEKEFETRIAWALIEDVPLLLGRTDVFNLFDICFKKNFKTLFTD